MSDFLPFALPDTGEEEIAEVVDSIRSGWLTTGPKTKRFERDFSTFIGKNLEAVSPVFFSRFLDLVSCHSIMQGYSLLQKGSASSISINLDDQPVLLPVPLTHAGFIQDFSNGIG